MKMKLSILLLFLLSNNILSSESAPQNVEENASMKIVIAKVLTEDEIKYLGEDNAKKFVESILKTEFPKLRAEQFKESFWSKIKEWLAKVTGNKTSNQEKLDDIKESVTKSLKGFEDKDVYDLSKIGEANKGAHDDYLAFAVDKFVYEQQRNFLEGIRDDRIIVPNIDTALTDNQKRTEVFLVDDLLPNVKRIEKNPVNPDYVKKITESNLAKLNKSWATREKLMHEDRHSKAILSGKDKWATLGMKTNQNTILTLNILKSNLDAFAPASEKIEQISKDNQIIVENAWAIMEEAEKFYLKKNDPKYKDKWLEKKEALKTKINELQPIISSEDAMEISRLALTAAKQMIDDSIPTQAAQVQPSSTNEILSQEPNRYKLNDQKRLAQLKNEADATQLSPDQAAAQENLSQKVAKDIDIEKTRIKAEEAMNAKKAKPVLAEAANIYHENQHPTTSQHPPISQHSLVPSAVPSAVPFVHNLPHVV